MFNNNIVISTNTQKKFFNLYHNSLRKVINTSKNCHIDTMCKMTGLPDGDMLTDFNLYGVLYRLKYKFKG